MTIERITYPGNLPRDVWNIIFAHVLADDLANNSANLLSLGETCHALSRLADRLDKRKLFKQLADKQLARKREALHAWQQEQSSYIFFSSYAAQSVVAVFDLCQMVFEHPEISHADKFTFITRLQQTALHNTAGSPSEGLPSQEHLQTVVTLKLPDGRKSFEAICADENARKQLQDIFEDFITYLYLAEGKRPNGAPALSYDVLRYILTRLETPKDVLAFALTCKTFHYAYMSSDNRARYFEYMRQIPLVNFIRIHYMQPGAFDCVFITAPLTIFETCTQLSLLERPNAEKTTWFEAMLHAILNSQPVTCNQAFLQRTLTQLVQVESNTFNSGFQRNTLTFTKTLLELFLALSRCSDNASRNKTLLRYFTLLKEQLDSMRKFQNVDNLLQDVQHSSATAVAEGILMPLLAVATGGFFFSLRGSASVIREVMNRASSPLIPSMSFWRTETPRERTADLTVLEHLPEITLPDGEVIAVLPMV